MNSQDSADLKTLENFITVLEYYDTKFDSNRKRQTVTCPFHDDSSPSLSLVFEDKGWFNCFGCGAGGNIFTFVALQEGLDCKKDFPKVLAKTRRICGINRRSI